MAGREQAFHGCIPSCLRTARRNAQLQMLRIEKISIDSLVT